MTFHARKRRRDADFWLKQSIEKRRKAMTYETSCGAVVFTRRGGEIFYVIIRSIEGYYGFPKGHMEGDETP